MWIINIEFIRGVKRGVGGGRGGGDMEARL